VLRRPIDTTPTRLISEPSNSSSSPGVLVKVSLSRFLLFLWKRFRKLANQVGTAIPRVASVDKKVERSQNDKVALDSKAVPCAGRSSYAGDILGTRKECQPVLFSIPTAPTKTL
jgi:hypothetical protein